MLAATAIALITSALQAAQTDLADNPLASSSSTQVKPNILFTLDDSGSMDWEYMPDDVGSYRNTVGFRNNQCNLVYYNPAITYIVPKTSTGGAVNAATPASFTAAYNDGFYSYDGGGSSTTNLSSSFKSQSSDTGQPGYYWTYLGTTTLVPLTGDCQKTLSSSSDSTTKEICTDSTRTTTTCAAAGKTALWRKVLVSATSGPGATDERQNFANWYSYYSYRLNMMKSAAGRVFVNLGDSYRVGFITINPGSPVATAKFLTIADFDTTQKSNWFTKFYSQTADNSTPLRTALSRAGRYFAGKTDGINQGMSGDPVQYSCQQNFTILTTDGYWNGSGGAKLNGAAMDNQDGNIAELDAYNPAGSQFAVSPRPIFDGATTTYVWHALQKEYRLTTSGCSGSRRKRQYRYNDVATTYPGPNQSGSIISGPTTASTGWTTDINCSSGLTLPSPNPQDITGATPAGAPSTCNATGTWPCELTSVSGGSSNSLADVAQYYYKTDLRTTTLGNCTGALGGTTDVCANNVPSAGTSNEDDKAQWQHMTTFTMGLGLSGTVPYQPDYKTATSGAFQNIRTGSTNWPVPVADSPTALDDLWHAAVNGRGQYFSAGNPDTVVSSLTAALAGVSARVASAAAAATSNLEPVAGDNFAYTAKYVTQKWAGELEAHEIDLTTGAVNSAIVWSAQGKLDAQGKNACDTRNIKLFRSGAANNLVDFTWNTFACDSSGNPTGSALTSLNATEQANFDATEVALLSQYPAMGDGTGSTANQRAAAAGANLVNFLRGQRGKEGFSSGPPATNTDINTLYRTREHILGDIINAQPVYVKAPFAEYDDAGYLAYKAANASRTPMVFAAANDGMLHAFYAGTSIVDPDGGSEAWAFIPTMVLPNLYKLASENYANQHTYSVDGTPTVGDVYDTANTTWKTILVGSLNKGGQGYYALDITDPTAPKALWEFKHSSTCYDLAIPGTWFADCHIGYTYSNPVISKLRDGRWVIFVTSGYNNVNAPPVSGDGVGYLYVLEAMTGKILYKISTGAGNATTPSGLNHINAWTENSLRNNQTERVYGVDLLGNVWRFDVNDILAPAGIEATRVATVVDGSGTAQPITTRPELSEVGGQPFVYVGTGRYLGTTDNSNTQTQSVWALRDSLTVTPLSNLRTTLKQMTITNQGSGTSAFRTIGCTAQCGSTDGWFADLPDSGERVNIDIKLQLGTLVVASNVPQSNACNIGGYSWLNYFNSATGTAVANSTGAAVGRKLVGAGGAESLAVGINIVRLPGGKVVVIATTSAAQQLTVEAPFDVPPPTGKRISWREIIQ
jgi:type IV pilus assembly protein PilY1